MDIVAQQSIEELRALIRQYPFASIFRVLLAKKTANEEHLTAAAIRVPSRVALNHFIHPPEVHHFEEDTFLEEKTDDEQVQKIERPTDAELLEINEETIEESVQENEQAEVIKTSSESVLEKDEAEEETENELDAELDKMYAQVAYEASIELGQNNEEHVKQEEEIAESDNSKAKFMAWLDKVEQDAEKTIPVVENQPVSEKQVATKDITKLAKKSTILNPLYYTETLGFIFEQQEKFDKAIEVYTVLMNRNPQKSDYFADKIKSINEKINS